MYNAVKAALLGKSRNKEAGNGRNWFLEALFNLGILRYCEEKLFYLRPENSGTADLTVTVYGQNLGKPLIFKFKLNFLVEKRTLTSDCLKKEFWEPLEEDFVFELLNKSDES